MMSKVQVPLALGVLAAFVAILGPAAPAFADEVPVPGEAFTTTPPPAAGASAAPPVAGAFAEAVDAFAALEERGGVPADDPARQARHADLDAAIEAYGRALARERSGEVYERRAAANREIAERHRAEAARLEDERRALEVERMERGLAIAGERERGVLTEEQGARVLALELARFERRLDALDDDLEYRRAEAEAADRLVQEMGARKATAAALGGLPAAARPPTAAEERARAAAALDAERFQAMLGRLSGFTTRLTMDANESCESCRPLHANLAPVEAPPACD